MALGPSESSDDCRPTPPKDGDVIGVGKAKLIFRYSEKAQKRNIELDRCPACNVDN